MIHTTILMLALLSPGLDEEPPPVLGVEGTKASIERRLRDLERDYRERWGGHTVEELAPSEVLKERNRALPIIAAVNEFSKINDGQMASSWVRTASRFSVEDAARYANLNDPELAKLRRVVDMLSSIHVLPESNFGIDYNQPSQDYPMPLTDVQRTGRLLTVSILADLAVEECGGAMDGMTDLLAFAEAFEDQPEVIFQKLRSFLDMNAQGVLRELLSRCDLPRKDLKRLSVVSFNGDERRTPAEMMLLGHVLAQQVVFDMMVEQLPKEDNEGDHERLVLAARLQALRYLFELLEHVSTARWSRDEAPSLERMGIPSLPEEEDIRPEDVEQSVAWLIQFSLANVTSDTDRSDLWRARRGLARTSVALSLYATDHEGEFPSDLRDLVPHYLGPLPLDPFSGVPFVYERTEDGFRLVASEAAPGAWPFKTDPLLDWSRPVPVRASTTEEEKDADTR